MKLFPYKTKDSFIKEINDNCRNTTVIYEKGNILLIKTDSFEDCRRLFNYDDVHWCIAHNLHHWDDYVGKAGHEQFFIIDFNKINSHNEKEYRRSLIGFTYKNGKLYAAHGRNDCDFKGYFEDVLKENGLYKFVIKNNMKENNNKSNDFDGGIILVLICVAIILILMTYLAFTH